MMILVAKTNREAWIRFSVARLNLRSCCLMQLVSVLERLQPESR